MGGIYILLTNTTFKSKLFYVFLGLIILWAAYLRITNVDFSRKIVAGDETAYENSAECLLKYGMFIMDRDGSIKEGNTPPPPANQWITNRISGNYICNLFIIWS